MAAKTSKTSRSTSKKTAKTKTATSTKKIAAAKKTAAKKSAAVKKTTSKKKTTKPTAKPTVKKTPKPAAKTTKKKTTVTKKKNTRGKKSARLTDLHDKLIQEREKLLATLDSGNARLSEMSGHGDLVDQSNDFREREIMMGMAEHDRERLVAINEALVLVEQGTYGICAMCEEEIPEARLLAVPTAKYCVNCQSKVETGGL